MTSATTRAIGSALIGSGDWVFLWKGNFALTGSTAYTGAVMGFFLYMVAFMDTVATIPTGSMAERWKWKSFVGWGLFCGAIYYPLFGAWTWGGGWLSQLGDSLDLGYGYVDFAGSGVVHAVGGVAALAGAVVLGPRIGKYGPDGKPRTMPGHHIPMALLGTFILLFGWFGFNAASTLAATDIRFAVVATNTAIAGAFGAIDRHVLDHVAQREARSRDDGQRHARRPRCDHRSVCVRPAVGGRGDRDDRRSLVIEGIGFWERRGVDDPVGAISVHGMGGLFGVLCVGIFADGSYGGGWNLTTGSTISQAYAAGEPNTGVTGILYDALERLPTAALSR